MAQKTNYHCDRCGQTISEHRNMLVATVGPLRKQLPEEHADLCQGCGEQFLNWLKERQLKEEIRPVTSTESEIPLGPVGRVARRSK